jgi:hypothetical protein
MEKILRKRKQEVKRNIFFSIVILIIISFFIYAYISISNTEKFEQPLISDSKYISLELLEEGTTSNGEKYEIIRDRKTNILYLKYDKGITPILDNDGKPKRLYDIQVDIIDSEGNVESTIEQK